jgi:hypothetical protein
MDSVFHSISYHVYREMNARADDLSNQSLQFAVYSAFLMESINGVQNEMPVTAFARVRVLLYN